MSHLKRTTQIHAPLDEVYALAHDPAHWSDWYVGTSELRDLGTSAGGHRRSLMVGTPFPLTQRVLDERLQGSGAHWRSKPEDKAEAYDLSEHCKMLILASEQDWTYSSENGDTKVTVVIDFQVPSKLLERAEDRDLIERMEAECLEQSLENLRQFCETTH